MTTPAKKSGNASLIPCLMYRDAPAAIEWLCRAFGFEKHLVVPGEKNTIAHAQLVAPEDVARLAQLKIPVVFTYAWAVRDFGYGVSVIPFIDQIGSLQGLDEPWDY